jgi:hypothetical protein
MIELVDDVPSGVLGLRAGGLVTPDDYRTVARPAFDSWLTEPRPLRVLAILDDDFRYADGDWEDASGGVLRRSEWHRLGVVTDNSWVRRMAPIGSMFIPARTRTFRMHRIHDAKTWVGRP